MRTPSIPDTFAAFGWEITPEWVEKYNTDPWVHNLTNALVTVWTNAADTADETASLLRSVEFALDHGRTSMVAFVDRKHVAAIERDFERMGEVKKQVSAMLDGLPPEPPMTPEREREVGAFLAAVLDKRFGDGSQEAVDKAAAAFIKADQSGRSGGSDE